MIINLCYDSLRKRKISYDLVRNENMTAENIIIKRYYYSIRFYKFSQKKLHCGSKYYTQYFLNQ